MSKNLLNQFENRLSFFRKVNLIFFNHQLVIFVTITGIGSDSIEELNGHGCRFAGLTLIRIYFINSEVKE